MDIRAAELTADHLGRTAKINPGDPTLIVGRLVSIRHKRVGRVGNAAAPEIETRIQLEVPENQRVTARFNAIDVVELV